MTAVHARAKLTLALHVVGTRADGYHDIEALAVSVSAPFDAVRAEPAAATSLRVTGPFAAGVPADATNLAWRAADALGVTLAIEVHKGIPVGAGLGGGSADAAAVLALAGADAGTRSTAEIAARLGADVPFCLAGGAAWMRGVGERLQPATVGSWSVVIATPPFGCATAAVYRAWDELGGPLGREVHIAGLPPLRNDLEPAAHAVEPRLAAFRAQSERAAGTPALLAGSGSSYAFVFRDEHDARGARDRIAAAVDAHVVLGRTVDSGIARA